MLNYYQDLQYLVVILKFSLKCDRPTPEKKRGDYQDEEQVGREIFANLFNTINCQYQKTPRENPDVKIKIINEFS